MKFRIDRSKWRCGDESSKAKGLGPTQLLNDQGFMCCLGHVELQLGLSEDQIKGKHYPQGTHIENILAEKNVCDGYAEHIDTELSKRAVKINDNNTYHIGDREQLLIELFKEYDHELEFYGEPVSYKKETVVMSSMPI